MKARSLDRKETDESAFFLSGDLSDLAPPDPIPNSEVKRVSVDASAFARMCESRSSPGNKNTSLIGGFFMVRALGMMKL